MSALSNTQRALWAEYCDLDMGTALVLAGLLVQRLYAQDETALAQLIDEAKAVTS